jgi:ketosteroid isomerase-like protein
MNSGERAMSLDDNVQAVKSFFAAIGSGDMEAVKACCSPDIEWIIPGQDWPLAGTRRGYAGLADLFATHEKGVETSFMETREFVAQGDRVLVIGYAEGKILTTGKPFKDDWIFAITVRDNKLTNIREYIDTQALARAAEAD